MGLLDRLRGAGREPREMSVPAGTEMLIGEPAEPPPEQLVGALERGATGHPEIRSAYLFQMMILAEGEDPHLTLGLDLDEGADLTAIANDLAGIAIEVLPQGASFNVYPLEDDMLESVAASVDPFYERI